MEIIEHSVNRFNGIVIAPEALLLPPQTFGERLRFSISRWIEAGYLLIWLEVPIERAALIPVATEAGFVFHHSQAHYSMLTCQLQPHALVPGYATHYIGIGGVVLNERKELLVVSELHRGSARPYYKLPGGALHSGEHLAEAAVREVFEETGVQTRFEAMVCFRHWHGYRYGKSDIYFTARLSPLSLNITKQDDEIDECLWMPVEEYLNHDLVSAFNREIVRSALDSSGIVTTWLDGYDDPLAREFFFPPELVKSHPVIPKFRLNGKGG
jgi:8-oxo-dGTP pyrophosphatase MutT (NUDIX family)